ncbi:MAG: NAD(P)/FAD-dependent oxidoreductase [Methylophilaceae bacterium]
MFFAMDKYDVIIVGAGIAGITTGYYLQKFFPNISYKIIESRSDLGGTWDQMIFPGVRSDSDMYTYGFSFNPWQGPIIGQGKDIKNYLNETAQKYNIRENILFNTQVSSFSWIDNQWITETSDKKYCSDYVICCTGSRDYRAPNFPKFDGEENFAGKIVHTQTWGDTEYKGKKIAIVGSGCTAVTMTPAIVKEAKSVTLIQRSPAWIVNVDSQEKSSRLYKTFEVLIDYFHSRIFKKSYKKKVIAKYPYYNEGNIPAYDYWNQRPACSLDHDYFTSIKSDKVSIEHQEISSWEKNGIKLKNGKVVDCELAIMATGLNAQLLGGIDVMVDNKKININDTSWYRGMMFSGIPNFFAHTGYINFSWTARCEIVSERICKTIMYMNKKNLKTCTPKFMGKVSKPAIEANYVLRAMDKFPSRSYKFNNSNYLVEYMAFKWTKINDGALEFQ